MKMFLAHVKKLLSALTLRTQRIDIVYHRLSGEGNRDGIHCMVAVVVAFTPDVFTYALDNLTFLIGELFS